MSDKPNWFDAVNQQFINIGEIQKKLQLQLEAQREMLNLLKIRIDLLEDRQKKVLSVYVDESSLKELKKYD